MFNLLLIALHNDSSFDFVIHSDLSPETRQSLLGKLQRISRRGLLADWGYAVPLSSDAAKPPSPVDAITPAVYHQPATVVASSSPLTSLTNLDEILMSPITVPEDLDETVVPVQFLEANSASYAVQFVALSELKETDDITLSMRGVPLLYPCRPSVDTSPLYRTVSSLYCHFNKC